MTGISCSTARSSGRLGSHSNALAEHSHSGITKTIELQVAADKVAAYGEIWDAAQPV